MSNVIAVVANVLVDDLEGAIPLYQRITGTPPEDVKRFPYGDLLNARVGAFLLIQGGPVGPAAEQLATILVGSVEQVRLAVTEAGGEVLEGPDEVPNGTRVVLRHPGGAVFEYLQPRTAAATAAATEEVSA